MRTKLTLLLLLLPTLFATPVLAEGRSCPDLATAVQVAVCPSDEELKYTYIGYCGDNARLYGRDGDTCETFEHYRKAKNIALWESVDGAYSGYLSCETSDEAIRAAKPARMTVERKGSLTRLICSYAGDVSLVHRTKAVCKVEGDGDCSAAGNCQASCE